jgi:PLP dependent protein
VTIDAELVASRLGVVRDRIAAAGGDPDRTTVVVTTKGFGPDVVAAALEAGARDLGESYAQELVAKVEAGVAPAGSPVPRWHFIGRVQSNKVRLVAPHVACWHSIDRRSLGVELARRAPGAAVLVQVAISDEPGKGGCPSAEVPALVAALVELGLDVRGLMGLGPRGAPEEARPGFRHIAELADRLALPERSMGMTDDLEVAVSEGATIVRVGRAIFGERPGPRAGRTGMRH